jgi:toxin ParE1/3/4
MSTYVLANRAREDLREIWSYTADRWGVSQADRYVLGLHRAMEVVANDPDRARACDHIRTGYRKYSVAAHVLFIRVIAGGVEVVRILHQRMDFERHL